MEEPRKLVVEDEEKRTRLRAFDEQLRGTGVFKEVVKGLVGKALEDLKGGDMKKQTELLNKKFGPPGERWLGEAAKGYASEGIAQALLAGVGGAASLGMVKAVGVGKASIGLLKWLEGYKRVWAGGGFDTVGGKWLEKGPEHFIAPQSKRIAGVISAMMRTPEKEFGRIRDIKTVGPKGKWRGFFNPKTKEVQLVSAGIIPKSVPHEFIHGRQTSPDLGLEKTLSNKLLQTRQELWNLGKWAPKLKKAFYDLDPTEVHAYLGDKELLEIAATKPELYDALYLRLLKGSFEPAGKRLQGSAKNFPAVERDLMELGESLLDYGKEFGAR